MTKRFSTVYNYCECARCGCEFEVFGACSDLCAGCADELDDEQREYDDEYHVCNCGFCFCATHVSEAGETCNSCLEGSHQG